MFADARDLHDGATLEADVCVVGAGPAGIALAREFTGQRLRVCVLESGGLDHDEATQSLAGGETSGEGFGPLVGKRARRFGGSTALWVIPVNEDDYAYRSAPLDEIDFEHRDWVPHSGWPFDRAHLDPYYARAHRVSEFGEYAYEPERWESDAVRRWPLDASVLQSTVWHVGPRAAFTVQHRTELERSENTTVWLHASVVEIDTDSTGSSVTRLHAACMQTGRRFAVAARVFVLATGGIENARLLLLSDRVHTSGLGNRHDLVGRYFMDHQYVRAGTLYPARRDLIAGSGFYGMRRMGEASVIGMLTIHPELLRRERLLNVNCVLVPRHRWYRRVRYDAVDAFRALVGAGGRLRLPSDAATQLHTAVRGLDYVAASMLRRASGGRLFADFGINNQEDYGGWAARLGRRHGFDVFEVILHTEQVPDPQNRVTLGSERDLLGSRVAHLHWRWGEANIRSILRSEEIIREEFHRAGLGTFRVELERGRPKLLAPDVHHHMGTTRMHTNPRHGVVDESCRVHGVSNLFVAGSSVFPTGGWVNPTLTIIALSLRLADHLKRVLAAIGSDVRPSE